MGPGKHFPLGGHRPADGAPGREGAFEGRDPVARRDQAGPVPDSEPRAMTRALAYVTDFVDRADGPGTCARRLLTAYVPHLNEADGE
ncbi:hypothetical protein SSP35_49_00050 [Streptomyces sp. NBRC 110611]|nr:hypothetical protein SSP35_49_00050 [Streptomyces sp. NBRC 110611]